MKSFNLLVASVVLVGMGTGVANAGQFEIWSDTGTAGKATVIVSFAGDGITEDAQADIDIPAGWKFVSAASKVPGSVCVGFQDAGKFRAVPPSGAGSALPSASTDYCAFTFSVHGKAGNKAELKPSMTECAAPKGPQKCGVEAVDVSEDRPGSNR